MLSRSKAEAGFSLLELMVVIALIGILATVSYTTLNSADTKVKGEIARLRTDVNFARIEAVNRNQAVLVDFYRTGDIDGDGLTVAQDSYRICVDSDAPPDNDCDNADVMIRQVQFNANVAYYDLVVPAPDGPDVDATADANPWGAGDGITLGGNRMIMLPNGTVDRSGSIYLYGPDDSGGIAGKPMAMVVLNTGRFSMRRWHSDGWRSR